MLIDLFYKSYCYARSNGMSAFFSLVYRKVEHGFSVKLMQKNTFLKRNETKVTDVLNAQFQQLMPLRIFTINDSKLRRINLVTDSVNSASLFGGVGTALIFAVMLANKLNARLRIITRTDRVKPENINHVLSLYEIAPAFEMQFKFAAFYDQNYKIDIAKNDLFITTSWWTTFSVLPSVPHNNIIYLLQEDERMFYPFGDERLKCENVLKNKNIRFVVNTKLLFNHFVSDGFGNIAEHGYWFEPAFPTKIYYPRKKSYKEKRKFFYYARPNNPRNLFYTGLDIIERCVAQNIFDLDEWEICLVGKNIPSFEFVGGYRPTVFEDLTWAEYAEIIGQIDLGLSLMYTPHPSYPPLDLVASGAVVVTNRFLGKKNLSCYSSNLICADLECDSIISAIRLGISLSGNKKQKEINFSKNNLLTDWNISFSRAISEIERMYDVQD